MDETRCPGCGRYIDIKAAWLDHPNRKCTGRESGFNEDGCTCSEPVFYCAEYCAERFHKTTN